MQSRKAWPPVNHNNPPINIKDMRFSILWKPVLKMADSPILISEEYLLKKDQLRGNK